jgi:polyisoprenoid-binding protein YceI
VPWELDSNLTKVEWSVGYLGIATVKGWFKDVRALLNLDAADPLQWKASIDIDAASIYSNYDRLEDHLRHADFLDAERYPTIHFESRSVERLPAGERTAAREKYPGVVAWEPRADHLRILGEITLHGITGPVELDAWYFGQATDPRGRTRRAFSATTSVRRRDFNIYVAPQIDPALTVASEEINLNFEVIATKLDR